MRSGERRGMAVNDTLLRPDGAHIALNVLHKISVGILFFPYDEYRLQDDRQIPAQ